MPYIAQRRADRCLDCGFCRMLIACPAGWGDCIGCGACALACPNEAVEMIKKPREREVCIEVDGRMFSVPERISIREALEIINHPVAQPKVFAPCHVGGCWGCAVQVDGDIKPACITPVKEGLKIKTYLPPQYIPQRIVHGFMGHMVGGVGTPWYLKGRRYIEVACFAAGCNFRCPQCQNWTTTYCGNERPLSPKEVAEIMTMKRKIYGVDRVAISGGECTLNRPWLIYYLKELRGLNPDARLHVDTNGSLLSEDYIDELVEAGMTDIGVDIKALKTETFMRITGLRDRELAQRYKETAWKACKYIFERYKDRVFLGIGVPYNRNLISLDEILKIGLRIKEEIDPSVQVCVLDYRPEFRSKISRPTYEEMREIHALLKGIGLATVICQTQFGHIGP